MFAFVFFDVDFFLFDVGEGEELFEEGAGDGVVVAAYEGVGAFLGEGEFEEASEEVGVVEDCVCAEALCLEVGCEFFFQNFGGVRSHKRGIGGLGFIFLLWWQH